MKKKLILALTFIMALTMLASCSGTQNNAASSNAPTTTGTPATTDNTPATVEPTTLVLACTALDPDEVKDFNSWGPAVKAFGEYVEKNSNGKYKVDIFYNFTYGSTEAEMFQLMQQGEIDFFFGAGLTSVDRRFGWNKIPFLFKGYDQILQLYCDPDSEGFKLNAGLFEENGVKLLAQNPGLERYIMSTKKPIKVPGDLKNETFRSYEDAIHTSFYGGLGNIVVMSFSDLYTSMQNGLITATDQQMPTYVGNAFYDIAPYYSFISPQYTSYSMMMGLDKFETFSEEDQQLFTAAAQECADVEYQTTQYWAEQTDDYLDNLNVTYYYPTDADKQEWIEYADSLSDKWKEVVGEELYDRAYEIFGVWTG